MRKKKSATWIACTACIGLHQRAADDAAGEILLAAQGTGFWLKQRENTGRKKE